jgi:peroxiredoxin Q/BCP
VEIWAVSPDPPEKLAEFAAKEGIEYTLLSDGDQAAINGWGFVNPANPKIPHPTAVIVDGEGVVRYLRQDVDYKNRPSASEILDSIDSLD